MSDSSLPHTSLSDWATHAALPFDPANPAALDTLLASLPDTRLLALGEPVHNIDLFLQLRNRIFQHLATHHGFSAIAIESSFPRGLLVNEFIHSRTDLPWETLAAAGFSHNFGPLPANRQLVAWMRQYNTDHPDATLSFHGCDAPTEYTHTDSPRQLLSFALDFLASHDPASAADFRTRIDPLLGPDAPWENPAANFDPSQSIGLSPQAAALRVETENLLAALLTHRPALIAAAGLVAYRDAAYHAALARQILAYHAIVATPNPDTSARVANLLALRDAMMADNLLHLLRQERSRRPNAKLFAFAHNGHLQRGLMQWQLGPQPATWQPAGAHLHALLGPRYANIASALAPTPPEPNTLETLLTAHAPATLTPTAAAPTSTLPPRTNPNPAYFPLTPQSLTDFSSLLILKD